MRMQDRFRQALIPGLAGLLAGVLLAVRLPLTAQDTLRGPDAVTPQAPSAFLPEVPAYRGLDANLFMQTAAEYRACCYQAYNLATLRLKERHAERKDKGKKLAVVMDLDETVLDNAGFQAMLLRSGLTFDRRLWDVWEEKHGDLVGLIPGAGDFIHQAEKLGVTVFYIGNRSETSRKATTSILERLRIPVRDPKQLKLKTKTSDKSGRRKEVEAEHTVLLYVGDNLLDFDEQFRCSVNNTGDRKTTDPAKLAAAIKDRKEKLDRSREKWGMDWIILPNPAYGEWTKPLGLGKKDLDQLVPSVPKQAR